MEAPGAWWQRGVVYQIYPRSFMDANGDGIGDLAGISERLGYLVELGVDAIWISPFYVSPMRDFGYDIADYTAVDPIFGSLEDFDRLIAEAHRRGLRLILDYVPNHTSDRHPWFLESRSSRANPRRDWYIWRDPGPDGGLPNNWLSEFGGSAWEWDQASGQYYYHAYLKEQPDLNWRHSAVRAAMLEVLRFWLDRGVDGFRVDAIHQLIKDEAFRDNPPNPAFREGMAPHRRLLRQYTTDRPEVQGAVADMRRLSDSYAGERVLIGEAYLPIDRLMAYYGRDLGGFHLPFNFHLIATEWSAAAVAALVQAYEAALPAGAWPNWVLGNHDKPRLASRLGRRQVRLAAMLLLTLRGTPTLYYGDEIGMTDGEIPPDLVQDPWEKNVPGLGLGRDPERTPMQWDGSPQGGFTRAPRPWLPLAADHAEVNVAAQSADPGSIPALYRRLLAIRRAEPALAVGSYRTLSATDDVLLFERANGTQRLLVALNFSDAPREVQGAAGAMPLLSTEGTGAPPRQATDPLRLAGHEGVILASA